MPHRDDHDCRAWCGNDAVLIDYHDHEWCRPTHDDRLLFELLCLEGASVGLAWQTVLHKRAAYRQTFHGFDIEACARMTDDEIEAALANPGIIRARAKVRSVRNNARVVQALQREFGSLDAYLWGFVGGRQVVGSWERLVEVPTQSELSRKVSADLKRRGASFVGPVITYSYLQSIGIINDHLQSCDCWEACLLR